MMAWWRGRLELVAATTKTYIRMATLVPQTWRCGCVLPPPREQPTPAPRTRPPAASPCPSSGAAPGIGRASHVGGTLTALATTISKSSEHNPSMPNLRCVLQPTKREMCGLSSAMLAAPLRTCGCPCMTCQLDGQARNTRSEPPFTSTPELPPLTSLPAPCV